VLAAALVIVVLILASWTVLAVALVAVYVRTVFSGRAGFASRIGVAGCGFA
jgi:hypothetical protein